VSGATPTVGWVDGASAYDGISNPTNNGDAALDAGASSATSKRITFGSLPKTGTAYIRVGIPSGSNRTFTGLTIT
jgi:hypothetical protein